MTPDPQVDAMDSEAARDQGANVQNEAAGESLLVGSRHAAGLVTLARPQRGNAISQPMYAALAAAYPRFSRDPMIYAVVQRAAQPGVFCAGTDLAEIASIAATDPDRLAGAVGAPLILSWRQECFTKPTVSLIDGAVEGSGLGLCVFGTHRIAGENFSFSCPETAYGLIPGAGICHVLARMPSSIGVYLALTGRAIGRADAYRLGIATHCVDASHFDAIERHLADADPVDALTDGLHRDPGPGELPGREAVIARCFSAGTLEEIAARLDAETGVDAGWARETAAVLRSRSLLALKGALGMLKRARSLDLRSALILEYQVARRIIGRSDFRDRVANWDVTNERCEIRNRLEVKAFSDVPDDNVLALFAEEPGNSLELPQRTIMQATA